MIPSARHHWSDEAYGYLKSVIVTPAVNPCLIEFLHFDIQSTGQKSHYVYTPLGPSQCYVFIKQLESLGPNQFWLSQFESVLSTKDRPFHKTGLPRTTRNELARSIVQGPVSLPWNTGQGVQYHRYCPARQYWITLLHPPKSARCSAWRETVHLTLFD